MRIHTHVDIAIFSYYGISVLSKVKL